MMADMVNLLSEAVSVIEENGLTHCDVEFVALAKDIYYDSGYGINEIPLGLVVVGTDWWLSRGEYDGSEWWNFNRKPERPQSLRPLDFTSVGWVRR